MDFDKRVATRRMQVREPHLQSAAEQAAARGALLAYTRLIVLARRSYYDNA